VSLLATFIIISLEKIPGKITCRYKDNGKGFNIDELSQTQQSGMGYSNMVTRINSLNGSFNLSSEKEKGTKASITVPILSENAFKIQAL
jgi:signal transduction histidine kinase